jgi:cytochrome c oxidase cbb3-type subunit 4
MSAMGSSAVGVFIIVLMLVFIAIWVWAWLPYHKKDFDSLARMPMFDAVPRPSNDSVAAAIERVASSEDYR